MIDHVMSRGDRREDLFRDDVGRQDFIKALAEAVIRQKAGFQVFQVHAHCPHLNSSMSDWDAAVFTARSAIPSVKRPSRPAPRLARWIAFPPLSA